MVTATAARSAPTGTPILITGREVPIVGRVDGHVISVDLRRTPSIRWGDEAVLGASAPVERIAACTGISAYEPITKLTQRVAMEYIGD